MNDALAGCQIIVALAGDRAALRPRIETMEQAGAQVRCCTLGQNLWLELAETVVDLIVVVPEVADVLSAMVIEQLAVDPRTRSTPVALATDPAGRHFTSGGLALASDGEQGFIAGLWTLIGPMRRAREFEQNELLAREQLRIELLAAERNGRELREFAHEMRTMLSAIMGYASNLEDGVAGALGEDQAWHVKGILEAVHGATHLMSQKPEGALPAARPLSRRPPSAPPRAQRTLIDLGQLARDTCLLFEGLASRRAIALHSSADDAVCVWGDALKIKQIFSNLIINGLKYAPAQGEVSVQVRYSHADETPDGQRRRVAEVVVADSGSGIPPEHREAIFKRGFRLPEHANLAGEGLGLTVAREIALQHGGTLQVGSTRVAGSAFTLRLPQDRRVRARGSLLLLREGQAARELLERLLAAQSDGLDIVSTEDRQQFMERAVDCQAALVLASDEQLQALTRVDRKATHAPPPKDSR